MDAKQLQTLVGRSVALLMLVKAGDAVVRAFYVMRRPTFRIDAYPIPDRPSPTLGEIAVMTIPIGVYAFVALTLWGKPQFIFPDPESGPDAKPPVTSGDWIKLVCTVVGLVALANGLINLSNWGAARDYSLFLFRPTALTVLLIQPVIGVALILASSKWCWLREQPSRMRDRLFPPKTDYYSQLSDEEKEALARGD